MINIGGIQLTQQAMNLLNRYRSHKIDKGRVWLDGHEVYVAPFQKGQVVYIERHKNEDNLNQPEV